MIPIITYLYVIVTIQGDIGITGDKGMTGDDGAKGVTGQKGESGQRGATGLQVSAVFLQYTSNFNVILG